MAKRQEGPRVTVDAICWGCRFHRPLDTGKMTATVHCDHPEIMRQMGKMETMVTPKWCPFLASAVGDKCLRELRASVTASKPNPVSQFYRPAQSPAE